MKLERCVPCETPVRSRHVQDSLGFVPPLMLAVALAVMSVISGLH